MNEMYLPDKICIGTSVKVYAVAPFCDALSDLVSPFTEKDERMGEGLCVKRLMKKGECLNDGKYGIFFEVTAHSDIGLTYRDGKSDEPLTRDALAYFEKSIDKNFLVQFIMNKHMSRRFQSQAEYHEYVKRGNTCGFYVWLLMCTHIDTSMFCLEWVLMSPGLHDICKVNVTPLNELGLPIVPPNVEFYCGSRTVLLKAIREIEAGKPAYVRSYGDGPIIVFTSDKYIVDINFCFPL